MTASKTAHAIFELTALGTPENVAQRLRQAGVKGVPGLSCNCPIATYLNRETGNLHSVAGPWVSVIAEEGPWETFDLAPTNPIREFVAQFDSGMHDDLRDRGTR